MPHKTTDSASLSHLWANSVPCLNSPVGSEPHASRNVSREFFTAENVPNVQRLWSYSTVVATKRILKAGNVFLISEDTYSVTTAKHLRWARQSIPFGQVFTVPCVQASSPAEHARNAERLSEVGQTAILEFKHCREYVRLFKVKRSLLSKATRRYLRMTEDEYGETRRAEMVTEAEERKRAAIEQAKETKERRVDTLRKMLAHYATFVEFCPSELIDKWTQYNSELSTVADVLNHSAVSRFGHWKKTPTADDFTELRKRANRTKHVRLCCQDGTRDVSYNVLRDRARQVISELNGIIRTRIQRENFVREYNVRHGYLNNIFRTFATDSQKTSQRHGRSHSLPCLSLIVPDDMPPEDVNKLRQTFHSLPVPGECTEDDIKAMQDVGNELHRDVEQMVRQHQTRQAKTHRRIQERRRAIENAEKIERWKAGESVSLPWDCGVYLRVNGDNVQTSHRASIPVRIARLLWRFLKVRNFDGLPARIGHYTLDRANCTDDIFAVGCHRIPMPEVDRIASDLGLTCEAGCLCDIRCDQPVTPQEFTQ